MKTMMASFQTTPYSLEPDAGTRLRWREADVIVKATTQQTGGTFNLFEMICPAGFATTLDIHYAEDVAIFVLEGSLTFFWGREKKEAVAGSFFYQPRGVPHGFRVNGNTPAKILCMTLPGGMDQFIGECGEAATCDAPIIAAQYKIEILGPLPE